MEVLILTDLRGISGILDPGSDVVRVVGISVVYVTCDMLYEVVIQIYVVHSPVLLRFTRPDSKLTWVLFSDHLSTN